MRLHPGDKLIFRSGISVACDIVHVEIAAADSIADRPAVIRSSDPHIFRIIAAVRTAEDFAVLELRAIVKHDRPEIACKRRVVLGQLHMLGRIVTEAVRAVCHALLQIV